MSFYKPMERLNYESPRAVHLKTQRREVFYSFYFDSLCIISFLLQNDIQHRDDSGPNTLFLHLIQSRNSNNLVFVELPCFLGSPSPKDGFAYYALSAPLLLIFSNNAVLVEKMFLLIPMPLMAITMYIFLRYMLNRSIGSL